MSSLLICQRVREWLALALKSYCFPKEQAIRAFKGEVVGERLCSSQTESSNLHGSEQSFSHQFNCFLYFLWVLPQSPGAGSLGSAKSAFCMLSDPETQKTGTKRICHLLLVTRFWGLLEFLFQLLLVLSFKPSFPPLHAQFLALGPGEVTGINQGFLSRGGTKWVFFRKGCRPSLQGQGQTWGWGGCSDDESVLP